MSKSHKTPLAKSCSFPDRTPSILLLGLNPSGRSPLAACLQALGLQRSVIAQQPIGNLLNKSAITRVNDQIFSAFKMSWTRIGPLTAEHDSFLNLSRTQKLMESALQAEFPKAGSFVIEDPRTSVLLGPWAKIISKKTAKQPAAIISLGDPSVVAVNLQQTNGISRIQANYLWLRYILEAEKASRQMSRTIVNFSTLAKNPRNSIKDLSNFLELDWKAPSEKTVKDILRLIVADPKRQPLKNATISDLSVQADEVFKLLSQNGALDDRVVQKALRKHLRVLNKLTETIHPWLIEADDHREQSQTLETRLSALRGKSGGKQTSFQLARIEQQRDAALAEVERLEEQLLNIEFRGSKAPSNTIVASPIVSLNAVRLQDALEAAKLQISSLQPKTKNGEAKADIRRYRALTSAERTVLEDAIDGEYYRSQAAEQGVSISVRPVLHYLREGARMGLSPHPMFDPAFYASQFGERYKPDLPLYADFIINQGAKGVKPHPLFDPDYYLTTNPDVVRANMLAHFHYDKMGWKESRSPNPWFYSGWYISQNPDVLKGSNPLLQYFNLGELQGYRPHPSFDPDWYRATYLNGDLNQSPLNHYLETGREAGHLTQPSPHVAASLNVDSRQTLICVAHSASERIYGSERSFLDVLSTINRDRYRIIVVLPMPEPAYVELVEKYSDVIHFTKRRWWNARDSISDEAIREFESLIDLHKADAVYTNTIVLREPLVAARNMDIPAICHIREAIVHDDDLCKEIGLSAEEIIRQVRARSDYLIANSQIMTKMYGEGDKIHLIYNAVNVRDTLGRARWRGRGTLVVGSLSSNLPKKGIADVVSLAQSAQKEQLDVAFKLFGPLTDEAKRLMKYCKRKKLTNVEFPGYAENAAQAINQIDIVVNFSQFAESFGRTIAEAAAAARPAIVYNYGALPEVVEDGVTGIVIPYLEPKVALDFLKMFIKSPDRYVAMGKAARERAETMFSRSVMEKKVNNVFNQILDEAEDLKAARATKAATNRSDSKAGITAPVTVIIPNYNYEDYLPERIRSILEQTRPPAEIIFLDDASLDNSVEVAEAILSESDIPYTMMPSDKNLGVYKQWLRGLDKAAQPWVWIAEADDSAEPDFLEKLLSKETDFVNIIYSQSRKIDGKGKVIAIDNRAHTNDVNPTRWSHDYSSTGMREVVDNLAFRNTIPNASAVLLRRTAINGLEKQLFKMQYTGDWMLYAHMLRTGGLAFVSEPLNHFRRHQRSVTRVRGKGVDYLQELARVRLYMAQHFPLRIHDFERLNKFLDRDYKIDGVKKNSEAAGIADLQNQLLETLKAKRLIGIITTNNGSYYGGSEMLWRETAYRLCNEGHEVVVLIKLWEPRPEFFDEMEAAGVSFVFKSDDGFSKFVDLSPDLTIVSIGDQDEGIEYYPELSRAELPYVIVNQLTKEPRFWAIRETKTEAVKAGYQGAVQAFFTSRNNHRVMEDRLAAPLPNGALHFNPYHIDRTIVPPWPQTDVVNIAIPSKFLFIHKGQDILAEFLGKPEWQDRNLVFNFYGIGPDEDNLRKLARKNGIQNFVFHGRVSDISDIWTLNQALLMPSRMEGLPIMLVSAMLSGRVPIVTDIGGHAEVISDNICGFIASDPNPIDVAEALGRALARQYEWEEVGKKARTAILEFLPEDPVDDFVKKLMEIAT